MASISRKDFIKKTAFTLAGITLTPKINAMPLVDLKETITLKEKISADELAKDDTFWSSLRKYYTLSDEIINLNHGGVSPQPIEVQRAHIKKYKYSNQGPAYFMWRKLDEQREPLRQRLADMLGCDAEEVCINRNTTEGLNSVIFGLPLQKGDAVVLNKYDYPNMMNAWQQREERDGIQLNWVDIDFPTENDATIVKKYEAAITPNTKVVHITHIINWTGQILPVRKIADMARKKDCEVIVDGAHSFAHINFKLSDLNCDYFATSLHKWLCAPFGTGALYIKREKISKIWPLLSAYPSLKNDIRKFEQIGTRSFGAEMAVLEAIDFHQSIGLERKEKRMHFLKNYLISALNKNPNIKLYTSINENYSAGLVAFAHKKYNGDELANMLLDKYKILSTQIVHHNLNGIRIAPHFFTSVNELDILINALKEI
jgi:selenocysteine lyase/cysteine desulfurase